MERPAWTIGFGIIWILMAVGAIITHLSLTKVNPSIEELPDRLFKGFMDVLKIDTLEAEIKKVADESEKVFEKADFNASKCGSIAEETDTNCFTDTNCSIEPCFTDTNCSIAEEKAAINKAFDTGLKSIEKVGNDKYFGVGALATTGSSLTNITDELNQVPTDYQNPGDCCKIAGGFCVVHTRAKDVLAEVADVRAQIEKFKSNDHLQEFQDNADKLKLLHVLPYTLVFAMVCFGGVWWRAGNCCCCHNGHWMDCIPLVFFALFWLISFIIMTIIAGISWAVSAWAMAQEIKGVFKSDPTLGELLDHIQDKYPNFWKYVFDGLIEGLEQLRTSSTIFVVVCILGVVYACCFCCCKPYKKEDGADGNKV